VVQRRVLQGVDHVRLVLEALGVEHRRGGDLLPDCRVRIVQSELQVDVGLMLLPFIDRDPNGVALGKLSVNSDGTNTYSCTGEAPQTVPASCTINCVAGTCPP